MKNWFTAKDAQRSAPYHHYFPSVLFTIVSFILCIVFFYPIHQAQAYVYSPLFFQQQQDIHITGQVVDQYGKPLAGVSIRVRGSNLGAITDNDGRFSLDVPEGSVLEISFIGYQTQTVTVGRENQTLHIQLQQSASVLNQLVVIGYGTQKKSDVTGAISTINSDAITVAPAANIQQALQGKAAGLQVQTVGTIPGSGAQIRIRGTKSISGSNSPLIVVDGIPYDGNLNDIDINNIASISVLKDASATAIYGSRASNGVILVTTKKGQEGPARITYNGYYGIGKPEFYYPVFNGQEYAALRNISPWTGGYMPEELQMLAAGKTTNWQKLIYQTSHKTNHDITISGGGNGTTYSYGGGYYNETTLIPGVSFTRYSLHATVDSRVGKKLRIGLSTINALGIMKGAQFVAGGTMYPILALSPLMPPYDSSGNILKKPSGNTLDLDFYYNPLYLKYNQNWVDQQRRLRTFNSLFAQYDFTPWLNYRFNLGLNYDQEEDDQFQGADQPNNPDYFRPGQGNTAYVNNFSEYGYTAENLLNINKTFQKHTFNFTGLYSIQEYHSHNTSAQKDSITSDFVQFYNMNLSNPTPAPVLGGGEVSWSLISYMGRLNYSYADRYLLTVTERVDGSSRLAPGHKWHAYTAVGLGWNIRNESFMQNTRFIDQLKLRVTYGQTSNQAINPYQSLGLVSQSGYYNFGPTIVKGYNVVTLPNPNLNWEYTKQLNVGLDYSFLNGRIYGSLEYYHEHTYNILYAVSLPVTSGVPGAYTTNIGTMQNWGMEWNISTQNIHSPGNGFNWTTDLNLFFNRNKLLSLGSGFTRDIANQLFPGYSMTSIYDYKKIGIWQLNQAKEAAQYGSVPGQIRLADLNHDGVIDQNNDRTIIGNQDAKLQGGMINTFTYKGFDLSIFVYARFGGLLISQIHQSLADYLVNLDGRRNGIKVDYWTPTNPTNWFPEPTAQWSPINSAWTTLGYYDATYVKLKSINLGYTFSTRFLNKFNIRSLRLYLSMDNVAILFSPYYKQTGIDPAGTTYGNGGVSNPGNIRSAGDNSSITINATIPPTRSYLLGMNLNF